MGTTIKPAIGSDDGDAQALDLWSSRDALGRG